MALSAAAKRGGSLAEVKRLADELEAREIAAAEVRDRLGEAIRQAFAAGEQQTAIARAAGVSRQRVGQLLHRG